MKLVRWMILACVLSCALAGVVAGRQASREIWLGMCAPLVVAACTWILTERVYKQRPERLTSVMIGALAGKLIFFGAYVAVAIGVLHVQPVPFIVSFTGYFVALHLIEALWMKRLFAA
jgi:hypothetical protein